MTAKQDEPVIAALRPEPTDGVALPAQPKENNDGR
jgi:hypothetical protein